APQDPVAWEGIRDATTNGSNCAQITQHIPTSRRGTRDRTTFGSNWLQEDISGSEDCLYLNVYTPENTSSADSLPVMVYIYGGAFQGGSGSESTMGPEYILEKGIVIVFINYRVNIF
ncbi:unnamed protein product, partial [Timema podura]|nr:unnamed protein product [Timema podura]